MVRLNGRHCAARLGFVFGFIVEMCQPKCTIFTRNFVVVFIIQDFSAFMKTESDKIGLPAGNKSESFQQPPVSEIIL